MIAVTDSTRRTMYAKGGATTYIVNTYSSSDTSVEYVVVYADDRWEDVIVDDLETVEVKEPEKTEQDENTGERPATWERPNRRLATVSRAGRKTFPRKAASSWG